MTSVVFSILPLFFEGVVTYEGDTLPETVGWTREPFGFPERVLDDGELVQTFDALGDRDAYRRSLADFSGASAFFAEWRVQSDAPGSLLDLSQIPTSFVLGGSGAAFYHVVITEDRVQFLRDTFIPLIFADIDPSMPHTYRLELLGDSSYKFLIDGQLVDHGVPEGPYPYEDARIVWGARFYEPSQTVEWDYVRYGAVPEPATGAFLVVALLGVASLRLRPARRGMPRAVKGRSRRGAVA